MSYLAKTLFPVLLIATIGASSSGIGSWQASCQAAGHGRGNYGVHCPRCEHVCELELETTREEKHCWKVESVPICIPRITFPWHACCQACGARNCDGKTCLPRDCPPPSAKLKYVRRLVKHQYECEHCKYTWTPVRPSGKHGKRK